MQKVRFFAGSLKTLNFPGYLEVLNGFCSENSEERLEVCLFEAGGCGADLCGDCLLFVDDFRL